MVAAAGGRADVVGIAFPLTILQRVEAGTPARERRLHGSLPTRARCATRSPCRSTTRARCSWRRCSSGRSCTASWWSRRPKRCPGRSLTRCRRCPHRWPWPWRAPRSPKTCCAKQSEARFASLVQNSSDVVTRARTRHDDTVREPVGRIACSAFAPEAARRHEVRGPDPPRRHDARAGSSSRRSARPRGTPGSSSSACATATAPTSRSRRCAPTCCTTAT